MAGAVNWFEVAVEDTGKAAAFFGAVLGWQTTQYGDEDYHLVTNGSPGAIGVKGTHLPHSRVYFSVDDLDAALTRTAELGGKPGAAVAVPGLGRIAHCEDDQGTAFSLYQQS